MDKRNQTIDKMIILMGFQLLYDFRIPFFLLIFVLFILTLSLNVTIATLIYYCPTLHHPMFFFLSHLSVCDTTLTTSIVPVMLPGILKGTVKISIAGCIFQIQIFATVLSLECLLLVVMSYDRYLAICHPLRYTSIMNQRFCCRLVTICWALGFMVIFSVVLSVSRLEFCGTTIDHFFCDFLPVLQLSCSDTSAVKLQQLVFAVPVLMFTVISIIVTYAYILSAIFRIPSISGRQKAFSTCSSHVAIVGTFLGSLIGIYILPSSGNTLKANKILSLLYTIGTPLFNPIIYCVRNKEIKVAFEKCIWKRKEKEML
ncbi:hypothetical protein GDO86_016417 [Hymenochirus boettgeri]|uniref:Olfactory receptor n=1 Tax=Hymenochirus boettgeri TaxID=247094 RepID=A0A8T2K315_9PIPI|nr:hypothetical protein GDO86_016417 [Hymenochirus boettgeri]